MFLEQCSRPISTRLDGPNSLLSTTCIIPYLHPKISRSWDRWHWFWTLMVVGWAQVVPLCLPSANWLLAFGTLTPKQLVFCSLHFLIFFFCPKINYGPHTVIKRKEYRYRRPYRKRCIDSAHSTLLSPFRIQIWIAHFVYSPKLFSSDIGKGVYKTFNFTLEFQPNFETMLDVL